jgi:hypothetical protein
MSEKRRTQRRAHVRIGTEARGLWACPLHYCLPTSPSASAKGLPHPSSTDIPLKHSNAAVTSASIPLLPLHHFRRRFVLDLQVQILKSDGQIPTVARRNFFGLEFTEKLPVWKHWQFRHL